VHSTPRKTQPLSNGVGSSIGSGWTPCLKGHSRTLAQASRPHLGASIAGAVGALKLIPLVVLACGVAVGSPALAASPIAPAALEIPAREFPGFTGAHTSTLVARNAHQWAIHFHESPAEERVEEAENAENGFEEAVVETFTTKAHREGIYEAQVFSSVSGAVHEVAKWTLEAMASRKHNAGLRVSKLPGVVGSVVFSEFLPKRDEGASNVVFSVGRCWLHVSDEVEHASTRTQSNCAAFALARALDRRMKRVCP
jgi:hypothetical protein